ncbi:MAG: hypothetical protein AB7P04_13690 [Bacteriovoracia bacterium]
MIFLVGFLPLAGATTFSVPPFPKSVESASIIVRGVVGTQHGRWASGRDGVRRIFTYTEIAIDEVVKGKLTGNSVVVRDLGGEVEKVGMQVPGAAQFLRGQSVVVFMEEENPDGSHDVWSMALGKYDLEEGADGVPRLTGPGLGPVGILTAEKPGEIHEDHSSDRQDQGIWTIEKLRQLVQDQATPVAVPAATPAPKVSPLQTLSPPRPAGAKPTEKETVFVTKAKRGSDWSGRVLWIVAGFLAGIFFSLYLRRKKK